MFWIFAALATRLEERAFVEFMRENGLVYTGDEYSLRFGVFMTNLRFVQEFNARKGVTFKVGLNKLACLTPAEYRALQSIAGARVVPTEVVTEPENPIEECDWRTQGVISEPADQGECAAAWAISAAQAVESNWAVKTGTLTALSSQNLIDCVTRCQGCQGGYPSTAYQYVIDEQDGMFVTAADYPYTGSRGTCAFDASKGFAKLGKYLFTNAGDEQDMKRKVALRGPATSCIDATKASFQLYVSGVYDEPSCSQIIQTHAVGCVGFGATEDGVEYWIMKNSWGVGWGEQGYVRMARNKQNQCGVATNTLVPVV